MIRTNSQIQQHERLYGWHALKVPVKSLEAIEMSMIMALCKFGFKKLYLFITILGHLTEGDSNLCWNMQLNTIPESKSMRSHIQKN